MSRGFGSTLGAGTTDAIGTKTFNPFPTKFSFAFWVNRNGTGGSGNGRFLQCNSFNCFTNGAGNKWISFQPIFSSSNGNFGWLTAQPSNGLWNHIAIVYDASNTTNVPSLYLNGAFVSPDSTSAPAGSFTTTSTQPIIGNNAASGGVRNWDGMFAHYAFWSTLLTAQDVFQLAQGVPPITISPNSLSNYAPLDGVNNPEPDLINGTSSAITGTRLGISDPPAKSVAQTYQTFIDQQLLAFLAARAAGANATYYGPATP